MVAKQPREEQGWYKWAEAGTRFLMMLRNVSVSYRNTYNLNVPGFRESVGALLGQNTTDLGLTPGIGFGLGLVDDSYIDKARENGWLMTDTTLSTPATSATTQDVQIKATLEPFTDLKIDLNMSHTRNDSKSIQYMFPNRAPSLTGSFNMTTITISTAFSSMGTADNGYSSSVFDRFLSNLDVMQQRIQQRYEGTYYPAGMPGHSGKYDASKTPVSRYSADVMIPAFLAAYQGRDASSSSTDVFPNLLKMLPNWSLSYKGLGNLPWVRDHFKSVTLTHAYKSIYSIGAYNSYSNYIQAIGGNDMGYAGTAAPGVYTASSVYDISTVSINETFSPLVGLNLTFNNNMTLKAEYKTARVSTLSITSAQINETSSKDFVIGWGWKINDFRLSSLFGGGRKASKQAAKSNFVARQGVLFFRLLFEEGLCPRPEPALRLLAARPGGHPPRHPVGPVRSHQRPAGHQGLGSDRLHHVALHHHEHLLRPPALQAPALFPVVPHRHPGLRHDDEGLPHALVRLREHFLNKLRH